MKNVHYVIKSIGRFKRFLRTRKIRANAKKAGAVLVQVFSSQTDLKWIQKIEQIIENRLPLATIVGTSTAGEIADGYLHIGKTVVSFSFFETSQIKAIAMPSLQGKEAECGWNLRKAINAAGTDIAGVLLYATPLSMDVTSMLESMSLEGYDYPIFGGGAGVYTLESDSAPNYSMIFCGNSYYKSGVAAVVFMGKNLHICTYTDLGWQPLSKEMTITDIEGMKVKKVNGEKAFDIYKRYLNIERDNDFMFNVLQFPFLLERDGKIIARVPFFTDIEGNLEFVADLKSGEKFRIGYGNPEVIVKNSVKMKEIMKDFSPDVIFLFNCICHRFLLQNEVNLETRRFQEIAPTVGFYTYGEFYGEHSKIQVQNSTMIAIGMREDGVKKKIKKRKQIFQVRHVHNAGFFDPYANRHNLIVSRLVHFISVVTAELEQANRELLRISEIDKLTQLYNRMKLDQILENEFNRAKSFNIDFSVIMVDVDYFKRVNDYYGHATGDEVLKNLANLMRKNIRSTDYVGRWGGEEFLLVLTETSCMEAEKIAEKLRKLIEKKDFLNIKNQTCSFGVTSYAHGDSVEEILKRVDQALYKAKNSGRNRVVVKSENNIF